MSEVVHAGLEPKKILAVVRAWANSEYGDGPGNASFEVTASEMFEEDHIDGELSSAVSVERG